MCQNCCSEQYPISIHALREEGDCEITICGQILLIISIHALREEGDLAILMLHSGLSEFLSTPSARRATSCNPCRCTAGRISIHALREEGDNMTGTFYAA